MSTGPVALGRIRLADRMPQWRPHPIALVIGRRLLQAIPLLFVVSAITFALVSLSPSDTVRQLLGENQSPAAFAKLQRQLGLNLPLYEQYWDWLKHAITGNFGTSVFTDQPVRQTINQHLPVTLSLIILSLLVVGVVGIGLGTLSAVRGGWVTRVVDGISLVGYSLPSFWLGTVLVSLFAVNIHLFPVVGYVSLGQSPLQWLRSLALPVVALSLHSIAALAKQTREAMQDALNSEYIRMARANGIPSWSILFQHALKNASIRISTIFGLLTVGLLGGTVIVENLFSLPGMGSLAVQAATEHDIPLIEGLVVYYTVIVVIVNLIVDVAYTWLDPRVRTS